MSHQSLVIPFTFLIYNQRDTILNLLESSTVDGRPGLHIFIQTFCENAETFQGFWPARVSTLAICSLFASERSSLQNLTVKGDIVVKPENKNGVIYSIQLSFCLLMEDVAVIMTRSMTKKSTHAQLGSLYYLEKSFLYLTTLFSFFFLGYLI
jgi:hypothetical protein